jgi:hypothetical protein
MTLAVDQGEAAMSRKRKSIAGREPAQTWEAQSATQPTRNEIRIRAYEIYIARGDAPGDALSDWLAAERELRARYGTVPTAKSESDEPRLCLADPPPRAVNPHYVEWPEPLRAGIAPTTLSLAVNVDCENSLAQGAER